MRYFIILLLFIAAWFSSPPVESEETTIPHIAYVNHFLKIYPERRRKALEIMPVLEMYSLQHGFDPLVPTVMIACESAWMTSAYNPSKGEVGLMQVHGLCAKGQNLKTADGQLRAGIRCMSLAREACDGSIKQMITMYMSGHCRARTSRTRTVVERRLWLIKKWGGDQ